MIFSQEHGGVPCARTHTRARVQHYAKGNVCVFWSTPQHPLCAKTSNVVQFDKSVRWGCQIIFKIKKRCLTRG